MSQKIPRYLTLICLSTCSCALCVCSVLSLSLSLSFFFFRLPPRRLGMPKWWFFEGFLAADPPKMLAFQPKMQTFQVQRLKKNRGQVSFSGDGWRDGDQSGKSGRFAEYFCTKFYPTNGRKPHSFWRPFVIGLLLCHSTLAFLFTPLFLLCKKNKK